MTTSVVVSLTIEFDEKIRGTPKVDSVVVQTLHNLGEYFDTDYLKCDDTAIWGMMVCNVPNSYDPEDIWNDIRENMIEGTKEDLIEMYITIFEEIDSYSYWGDD